MEIQNKPNKTFRFYVSEPLKNTLSSIYSSYKDEICHMLITDRENRELTLVDCANDKSDTITFISGERINALTNQSDGWKTHRNELKVGRMVKKLYGDMFSDKQIEEFVNRYKSSIEGTLKISFFEIVSGNAIADWYHVNRYAPYGGTLGNSCMRNAKFLELYVNNPEKISLLILKDPADTRRIIGRSLIWTIDEPKIKFMDRIYTSYDSDIETFKKYAKMNGIYCKNKQVYGGGCGFINPENSNVDFFDMKVSINKIKYNLYPYLDTLRYFNKAESYLTSSETNFQFRRVLIMPDGSAQNDKVACNVTSKMIELEDSIMCDYEGGFCHRDHAIWHERVKSYVFARSLVDSKYHGMKVLKGESLKSQTLNDYILSNDVINVTTQINGNIINDYVPKDSEIVTIKGKNFLKKDIVKAYNGHKDGKIKLCPSWETIRVWEDSNGKYLTSSQVDEESKSKLKSRIVTASYYYMRNIDGDMFYSQLNERFQHLRYLVDNGDLTKVDELNGMRSIINSINVEEFLFRRFGDLSRSELRDRMIAVSVLDTDGVTKSVEYTVASILRDHSRSPELVGRVTTLTVDLISKNIGKIIAGSRIGKSELLSYLDENGVITNSSRTDSLIYELIYMVLKKVNFSRYIRPIEANKYEYMDLGMYLKYRGGKSDEYDHGYKSMLDLPKF